MYNINDHYSKIIYNYLSGDLVELLYKFSKFPINEKTHCTDIL